MDMQRLVVIPPSYACHKNSSAKSFSLFYQVLQKSQDKTLFSFKKKVGGGNYGFNSE